MFYINISYSDIEKNKINVQEIEKLVEENGFPYKKYFMGDAHTLFNNITKLPNLVREIPDLDFSRHLIVGDYDKWKKKFQHTFNGEYLYIYDDDEIYESVNILTDYFTEKPRIDSIGYGQTISHFELWRKNYKNFIAKLIREHKDINAFNLREEVYAIKSEARMGKINVPYSLYKFLKAKKILDPCAGWGDRLIAAIANGCEYYCGVDPNTDLIGGYEKIVTTFVKPADKHKYKFIFEPFEKTKLNENKQFKNFFDIVIVSPPPFVGDIYGNPNEQSIENYKTFDEWFEKFMMKMFEIIYDVMCKDGFMLISFLDRIREKYAIVDKTLNELTKRFNFKYKGVIAWTTSRKKYVPYWIFIKY